jgi:Family of unknown function (DUF6152)
MRQRGSRWSEGKLSKSDFSSRVTRLALAGLLLAGASAQAHHSFAMFDHDHQIKITGTVTHFQWTNPHVYIDLDVSDNQGGLKHYTIECANPGILDRIGWKFNMIKEGDKITTIIAPLRTGEAGGLLKQVTLADGRKFLNGGPAGLPNIQ